MKDKGRAREERKKRMAQKLLLLTYSNQLHKCHLTDNNSRDITIGNAWTDDITYTNINETIKVNWNGSVCEIEGNKWHDHWQQSVSGEPMEFYLLDNEKRKIYDITGKNTITIGGDAYADIRIEGLQTEFVLIKQADDKEFTLNVQKGNVYHNFSIVSEHVHVHFGDHLFANGIYLIIGQKEIQLIDSGREVTTKLVTLPEVEHPYKGDYPNYHRSPRIIYREPEEKKELAKPSNKPSKPSEQLARTIVPSLVLIVALVLISFVNPRGIYIIVMLAVTVTTIIFSITSYVKNVRKYKRDMIEREDTYKNYLQRKTKELYQTSEEQRHALNYHYPDIEEIRNMAVNMESRLYEKTMFHHDFLYFRTGLGEVESSFEINFNEEEFTQEKDELVDQARELLSQYQRIENVPIVTSLMKGPVGYIGHRQLVLEQLQLLVMQLSIFHSYHDLQFITIFPEEEKHEWDWMRWLPHASMRDVNVRGFVYHERSRDQVLNTMYQILKERKLILDDKENSNEKTYFTPHFVVLITDEKMILDHTIMEFFNEDPSEYGVSLVFVQDVMHSLPEHVKTVIDIRDAKHGNIILEEAELVNKRFTLDHFRRDFNKEDVSRALAPINHLQSLKNSIPESVTFLEMYGVENVEELAIEQRWKANETYKSLAVPLGLRGKEDVVQLNLHEKAHGPHGLVAGTTGSGKSEIIQSYILSLGVNFHPHEVAFLLIDYKGGGMANLFKNMPHLVGTITNLDAAQSMRALASIKAELQKRQRLFGEHDVNHINQYQKLYKQGEASEAMPHLFLISDEFAELKSEQPDFMKELVSTARIGRSLGIHLILATQKPSGVVDDQIWSNSKFKLALKVQNEGDSNEILKTPDAAEITLPGRAYLQVGNNEIYELFQSAFSGADYVPDKDNHAYIDTTIYAINELGQYDILTEDLSGLDHKENIEKVPTELEAVIDYIADYAKKEDIEQLSRPWLPPLPEQIFVEDLHPLDYEEEWKKAKKPLNITIGMLDQPELQSQSPLELNLSKDGHIAVFSSPGYGKSTFLQTVVIDLVLQHNPAHLHVYLLDFGTNGLLPLKNLPHVADTIQTDDEEKIGKFVRLLTKVIKERKQKLSHIGVANLEMYERASGDVLPNIFIVIDNYDSVRDVADAEGFEKLITQIAREGASLGLNLAISAGRQSAMRMPLLSNIKIQVPLYLIETSEVRSIVGRTDIEHEEIPGRGLIKLEDPVLFQAALPARGYEPMEIIANIQGLAKEMGGSWQGERPKAIPMVPEVLDFEQFRQWKETKEIFDEMDVSIAVDTIDVQPVRIRLQKESPLKVIADSHAKVTDTVGNLIDAYIGQEETEVIVIDNEQYNYVSYNQTGCSYGVGKEYFEQTFQHIESGFHQRKKVMSELRKNNASLDEQSALLKEMNPVVIFITDYAIIKNTLDRMLEDSFLTILRQAKEFNISFVFAGQITSFEGYDDISKFLRESGSSILFTELKNQNLFSVSNRILYEKNLEPYEAYYIENNLQMKVKTAKKGGRIYEHVES